MIDSSLLKRSLLTIAAHGFGRFLNIIVFIFLARILSTTDYGYLIFGSSIAKLVAVIALLGCLPVFVKQWGKNGLDHEKKINSIFNMVNWYKVRGLILILICMLSFYIYSQYKIESSVNIAFLSFLFVVPLFFINLYQQFLNSIKKSIHSGLMQTFFYLLWLVFISFSYFFNLLDTEWILIGSILTMTSYVLLLISYYLNKHGVNSERPKYINRNFIFGQWAGVLFIYIDIILIEIFLLPVDIAFYGVVIQIVSILAFILGGVNMSIVAELSEYYNNKSLKETQKRITYYARFMTFFALIFTVMLVIFGEQILGIYGAEYKSQYLLLLVLTSAQLINVISGSNGWILDISGNEKTTLKAFYISIFLKIILGIFLIKFYGALGMAFAALVAIAFWNIYLVKFCINKIKLNPTIFNIKSVSAKNA